MPPLLSAPHTVRPYRVSGYVVVGWGITPGIDDPDVFTKVSRYTKDVARYHDVELLPLYTEKQAADEHVLPASPWPRWFWRLRGLWHNVHRARANRAEAKRLAAYYSPEAIEARVMRSQ